MLGPPKVRRLDTPVVASLERLVPQHNFYRFLEATLDLSFVRDWVRDKYADRGRPSIDPVVFFKLQLILFFEGWRSERKLIETASLHLAHRWYLGYALDEVLPDHSSLTKIRQRLGLPLFQCFFEHVVDLCQQAGLVWGKELLFDATKVRANADIDSLVPRFYLRAKQHVDELFAADGAADDAAAEAAAPEEASVSPAIAPLPPAPEAAPADTVPPPRQLPFPGTATAEQALAAENEAAWKLLDAHRLDPDRPASSGYRRITDYRVSTTDPDATPMNVHGESRLGYHDHYVVDGGKARIILQAFVTPADVMENQPMLDLLRRVQFRFHLHPRRAIGDTTYGTVENLVALEAAGVHAYMPLMDVEHRTPFYGPARFTYDAERDEYRCPEGQPLHRRWEKREQQVIMYSAEPETCNACPVKAACTASDQGRQVHRSIHGETLARLRAVQETPAYKKAMRKRQVWVEPLFGEAKDWHGLRRFRLRGLWKVNCEALRIAAGQNLKRWLSKVGWGRRGAPCGSLIARAAVAYPTIART